MLALLHPYGLLVLLVSRASAHAGMPVEESSLVRVMWLPAPTKSRCRFML